MTKVRRACGRVEEGGAQRPILWALEHDPGMTNYAVPFQIAALGGGPFETMRRATLDLVTSTVSSFLHGDSTDRAHLGGMGCAHSGRQTGDDYNNFVVTNWKDNAHIVHHHSSASAPSSLERRDGAHILSSWTAQEGSDVSCSTAQEEENIPSSLEPTPLVPGNYLPTMSEDSSMLSDEDIRALAMAVPLRHRWRHWRLLYSTARDGISLQTLYRRAPESAPCVLVVRDTQQHVFGCFTSESWRVAPRYYGTGESFVFQIQPKAVMWPWHQRRMALARNDFFQFGRPDSLALGGAPQYALYLDGDLQFGSSGPSDTFGSPCLASGVEFEVGRVELWGLV